jgi:hypothetical protein
LIIIEIFGQYRSGGAKTAIPFLSVLCVLWIKLEAGQTTGAPRFVFTAFMRFMVKLY